MKTKSEEITKQWVPIADAARFLGVSQDTLRRWEKKDKLIPRRTVGGHRRYSRKQLERILKQPMITILDQNTTYSKQIDQTSSSLQTPPLTKAIKQPFITIETKQNVKKYLKSGFFTAIIGILIIILLIASYFLLQITKNRSQPDLITPVPAYRNITLP